MIACVDIFQIYTSDVGNFEILKSVAKDYIIEKYIKLTVASEHLTDNKNETEVEVEFKFASSAKKYKYPFSLGSNPYNAHHLSTN